MGGDDVEGVLGFWFGELDADGLADKEHSARWWRKSEAFDQELRDRFLELHRAIVAGERQGWLEAAQSWVAYIVVLDQFSRNMFRGTPQMYAHDVQARDACLAGVERGWDEEVATAQRVFAYMPLMHSESLQDQERCVELFEGLRDALSGRARQQVAGNVEFAIRHRDIVARCGRFPHRNDILGRASTAEEEEFLREPGSGF